MGYRLVKNSDVVKYTVYIAVLLLAVWLRCYQIDLRPLHADEGVNHYFATKVFKNGFYEYSHENYHGPLYFYSLVASRWMLGDNISALRLPGVFYSIVCLLGLFLYRRNLSTNFLIVSTLLIGISSSAIFHSRYAIHEQLLVTISLFFSYFCFRWIRYRHHRDLYPIAVLLALMISVKETFVVTGFCILVGLLAAAGARGAVDCLRAVWTQRKTVVIAGTMMLAVVSAVYTAGFRWLAGLVELLGGIPQWIGRSQSDVGHHKPVSYYLLDVLLVAEPALIAGCVIGAFCLFYWKRFYNNSAASIWRDAKDLVQEDNQEEIAALRFFGAWALASLFVYSMIPYKMPWLIINFSLPAQLFISLSIVLLFERYSKVFASSVMILIVSITCYRSLEFNYNVLPSSIPYGEGNPYSYVHTEDQLLELAEYIREQLSIDSNAKLLITTGGYWPLPYYVRDLKNHIRYVKTKSPARFAGKYTMVLAKPDSRWSRKGWERKLFRVNNSRKLALYTRKEQQVAWAKESSTLMRR